MFQVIVSVVCAVMGIAVGVLFAKVKHARQVEEEKANVANLQASLRIAENMAEELKRRSDSDANACAVREKNLREEYENRAKIAKEDAEKRLAEVKTEAEKRIVDVKNETARRLENEKAESEKRLAETKLAAERRLAEFKNDAAQQREETEKRQKAAAIQRDADFNKQLETMKAQFLSLSEELLKKRTEDFKGANQEEMGKITQPLLQQIEEMRKALKDNKEGSDKNVAALNASIKTLLDNSNQIGEDAKNLANALRNRGKVQGDWGEQVLSDILRDSGMIENREFFTQKSFKGAFNNDLRPDVIVKFPDESLVIVDSKVSLTAYSEYLSAEDDEGREQAIKSNFESIRKHIDELAEKNYPKFVPNSVPYALMFVPNEGAYILAMNKDPQISNRAYKKGVIVVNPTNLMLVLSLVLLMWRNTHQEENCRKIVKAAENLYEKFCIFGETFLKVGDQLATVHGTYEKAQKQLNDGRGSIVSQITKMQELGIAPTKRIPEKLME